MPSTQAAPAAIGHYAPGLRLIHWLTAALVLVLFVFGIWTHYFDPGDGLLKDLLYNLHQSFGVAVWLLVLIRTVVRLSSGAPKLPAGTPLAIRAAASLNHLALYLVLLVQPVTGFLDTNANGFPLDWFGLFRLPSPIGKQPDAVAHTLNTVHWFGAMALLLLVVSHLAGAAYHGLIRRDGVVRHML